MGDLPDYTRWVSVNVTIPPSESGPTYVAKYQSSPGDITDGQLAPMLIDIKGRLYVVQFEKDRTVETLTGKYVRIKGYDTDEVKVNNIDVALSTIASQTTLSALNTKIPSDPSREGGNLASILGKLPDQVSSCIPVIARPKGSIIAKGNVTTGASYATVASRTVTNTKTFQLAKIIVSCDQDIYYKLRWNAVDISAEIYVAGTIPFTDWFPYDYYSMLGDGAKAFDIQVKYPSGGSAGTCFAEIVGEEV